MRRTDRQTGNYIKFLGTAGARYVVAKQLRYSGGVFLHLDGCRIILDPGPGTLVRMARSRPSIDPAALDAIILTHMHIDHSTDVNALIDAMTGGGFHKRGILFAPDECLNGEDRVVLKYLRPFLDGIEILKARAAYRLGDLSFRASVRHEHPAETYGIIFTVGGKKISFMADTRFFPGLAESYRDSDLLVLNMVFYSGKGYEHVQHLSLDDMDALLRDLRPKKIVLTHLGMSMVRLRPRELSAQLTERLGVETVVATDGMTLPV